MYACTQELTVIIIRSKYLPELTWNFESGNYIGKKLRNIEQFVERQ